MAEKFVTMLSGDFGPAGEKYAETLEKLGDTVDSRIGEGFLVLDCENGSVIISTRYVMFHARMNDGAE